MNILFVYYVPSGGVETLNRQRSLALKKIGMNCHFLYYENRRDLLNDHAAPVFITNNDQEIKQILETGKYQAIVITSDFQALPRFQSLGYQGKMIIEVQGYGPKHVARKVFQSVVPLVTRYADGLLNPKTPHIEQLFHELFPTVPKFQFNNCFDTTKFSYQKTTGHPHPIVAWIGRIEDNKNWREFLFIGAKLIEKVNPNIQLYMFEDPTLSTQRERQKFEATISRLNLQNHVTLHANVPNENMAEYYSRIGDSGGFLCSTSKVEGSPYAILEALSCKCPILTTDSDGVRSSIIHNETGKYYTIGNISEAVTQAVELMNNTEIREHIRSKGYEHVKVNFSPELYGKHFRNMLQAIGVN
ncbi:glycosyltransferase [Caldifermentibacillus hisashii]|uniref:glycosyltransferase family 4 protein n=1 Tax=Caldifermentibacillus hisashii TaxID=996558 RepID=UPI0031FCC13E|nr:glycosyltransferase [Caldibacillus thermoamylovorans]